MNRLVSVPVLLVSVVGLALLGPAASAAVWPLDPTPEVVKYFDPPKSRYGSGHRGVDLAGRLGQVVRATAAGKVTHAAGLAGRGTVTVTHGGVRTTYEPVTPLVSRGDQVAEGQPIGRLQVFGSHCFPRSCLHWGALRGEVYLDPLTLVGAGPVRLKPLAGLENGFAARVLAALMPVGVPVGMPTSTVRW